MLQLDIILTVGRWRMRKNEMLTIITRLCKHVRRMSLLGFRRLFPLKFMRMIPSTLITQTITYFLLKKSQYSSSPSSSLSFFVN